MKAGYKVDTQIKKGDVFLLVNNYHAKNEVLVLGTDTRHNVEFAKYHRTVGVWKIKK